MNQVKALLLFNIRLLFFRTTREEFQSFSSSHLLFGLFCTWLVGMGRWWDDPNADILQHLGLGSVAYIFVLAAIVWMLVSPLKVKGWTYQHVLTFISLTSLPALLYAIPVERFMSLNNAITVNVWFLGIVALWRVSLFFFYLGRYASLKPHHLIVLGLLPLSAIVTALFALNLHGVVFEIMGGLREAERSAHDGEYGILFLLTVFSFIAIIPLLLTYIVIVVQVRKDGGSSDLEPPIS